MHQSTEFEAAPASYWCTDAGRSSGCEEGPAWKRGKAGE